MAERDGEHSDRGNRWRVAAAAAVSLLLYFGGYGWARESRRIAFYDRDDEFGEHVVRFVCPSHGPDALWSALFWPCWRFERMLRWG